MTTPSLGHDDIKPTTDQYGEPLFITIPGYGKYTPAQLIACLEAQAALGAARADAAALRVRVQELETENKQLLAQQDAPCCH